MGSNGLIDHGGVDCLNWLRGEERKVGRRPGAAGIVRRRRVGWVARGRRKEREGGDAERRGPGVSVAGKKKKKRRRGGPARGRLDGPLGRLG
jgi:hypothetical protein